MTSHTFQIGIQDWPLALKAELVAIITIILILPINQKVSIYTDCKGIITGFNKLSRTDPRMTHKRLLKKNNWILWIKLIELAKIKDINITFIKSKAYSEDQFNNLIDK